ncbi:MAG TPA: hypothetical protein VHZ33_21995 [Trebonia sp.]|jgi:hypothetical protein|nr:hypothetical protein [Trebonia sp.]
MADNGNDYNSKVIEGFRANSGDVGGSMDVLLLHHTEARSGTETVKIPVVVLDPVK